MHIHPDIAALRSDPTLQRQAREAMMMVARDWRSHEAVNDLAGALEVFGSGKPLREIDVLLRLVADHHAASEFALGWVRAMIIAGRQAPLGEIPFRHSCSAGFSRVQLMQAGTASLSLLAYEQMATSKEPEAVSFCDRETHEMVISGSASGYSYTLRNSNSADAEIDIVPTSFRPGSKHAIRPKHGARHFVNVSGMLLVLQLSRTPEKDVSDTIEYSLADNSIIHRSSGDKLASQDVMALAVLGAMRHFPAASTMIDLAISAGNSEARWEAVRQLLALEPLEGIKALNTIAKRPDDPIADNAARLHAQLLLAYPNLADMQEAA